jgi:hypothetical protein
LVVLVILIIILVIIIWRKKEDVKNKDVDMLENHNSDNNTIARNTPLSGVFDVDNFEEIIL